MTLNFACFPSQALIDELLAPVPTDPAPLSIQQGAVPYTTQGLIAAGSSTLRRRLAIARELLMRELHDAMTYGPVLDTPVVLREWLQLYCAKLTHEVFLVLYLDAQLHLIEAEQMFRGTLTQSSVYPRELVKGVLARHASAVIIAHNHPSGTPEPSAADMALTRRVENALQLIEVKLLDHCIVARHQVVSCVERGLM